MANTKRFVAKNGILLKPYDGIPTNEVLMVTPDGYVMTGATISDFNSAHTHDWSDIYSTPTTISGYGITDAYTKTETDNNFLSANTTYVLNDLIDVNTGGTLNGYYLTYSGGSWVGTQDSTDLSGYYTKIETDNNFLSASTTIGDLSGYTQDEANANFLSASTNFDDKYLSLSGGTLTGSLNINPTSGYALRTNSDVMILGDLYVSGVTTTVNSENMAISDNLFLLNSGETGAGVTRGTAGFLVDRGTSSAVTLLFDENTFTIRVGETSSSITDNTIETSHTIPLAPYQEQKSGGSLTYWNNNGLLDNAPITVSGNDLIPSGLIDGVDIALLKTDFDSHTANTNNPHQVTFDDLVSTAHTHDWSDITSTPTTIGGYGITDAYTKTETDNNFLSANTTYVLNDLTDVNTGGTLEGYYLTYSGGSWVGTQDSTDLSGYYTKIETDNNFLSASTTIGDLSGYTQDEINNLKRYTFTGLTTDTTVDSFPITLTDAVHWQYSLRDGVNAETGTIMAIWDPTGVFTYTQYSTDELGDTSPISLDVDVVSGGNVSLSAIISSGTWDIKIRRDDI